MGAQELRQMIPKLVREGKTILLTTHYMSEADELSDLIAIIDKGRIIASGTPSRVKRQFSKIAILEVILRQSEVNFAENLNSISGIERVISSMDGPIQKLTIHIKPGANVREEVNKLLGVDTIESMVARDPTLEEAYLSIFQEPQ